MNVYYWGWGVRVEPTVRRRKNWRPKITFTNETTCNTHKTHMLKTEPQNKLQKLDSIHHVKFINFLYQYFIYQNRSHWKKGSSCSHAPPKESTILAHSLSHRIEKITIRLIFQGQGHIFSCRNRDSWISHTKIRPKKLSSRKKNRFS